MSKKTEIKVYLPTKMVGELESRKRSGVRSRFIAQAIREKLDRRAAASPFDFSTAHLLITARDKINDQVLANMLQVIIDQVNVYVN